LAWTSLTGGLYKLGCIGYAQLYVIRTAGKQPD